MKRMNVVGVAAALVLCTIAAAAGREAQWQKVRDAMAKGLPKTAIEALEPILKSAVARGDHPEAVRAIVQRVVLEGAIQGNKPEEKIRRLQAEIAKAPPPSRPILEAVLARWFWEYFRQNRWRFMQRTRTETSPGDDFTAWDLPRIYAEIDTHFTRALAAQALLRRTPIAAWDDLLERGNAPDAYRPTLYDFVAFEAIAFYTSGEQAEARPEEVFELSATGPIFAPAEGFAAWNVTASDSTAPTFRAIRLYQELLRFHANDRDPSARIDADLARLRFGKNVAVGVGKNTRYKEALSEIAKRHSRHALSARALADWAGVVREEGDLVEARRIALRGHERFPDSAGGHACWNLIQEIEQKALSFDTERVWNEPPPVISVHYRNLDQVYFRVVPFDFRAWVTESYRRPPIPEGDELDALLRRWPMRQWSTGLPATPDYRERIKRLPTPDDLPPGSYYLIASDDESFRSTKGPIHVAVIWVSSLALVLRNEDGELGGFVLNAENGSPLPNARIRAWYRETDAVEVAYAMTDSAGRFRVARASQNYIVLASYADQRLASQEDYWTGEQGGTGPYKRTLFFTDRVLYRPGQTIHYKGLCIAVDTERDRYEVAAAESLTVIFRDVNGQEVERRRHRTNDYGSFSGAFLAPQGRLLGNMSIVSDSPQGMTTVAVEEYKRPKFAVSFGNAAGTPRLGEPVSITGTATAYTGAAIDGANVSWHVVRQARYAGWWMPWHRVPFGESQQIAHGTTVTRGDGTFEVTFSARPDSAFDPKGQPVFSYTVHADVTDAAGETRSADRSVRVGYAELEASLSAETWLVRDRPFAIALRTSTLDHVARSARGTFTLHRLREPPTIGRPPLEDEYQMYGYDSENTPDEDDDTSSDPARWPDDMLVRTHAVATDSLGVSSIEARLVEGVYRAVFETKDGAGNTVHAEHLIRVVDPDAPRCGIAVPFLFDAPAWSVEPGDEFLALWGSGYDGARAFVEIEHRGRLLQAFWTSPERTQVAIRQRVTEEMRGGFTLRVLMVYENRAHIRERHVDVPWTNQKLHLRWERFVSKLEPGARTTWTAVVTGPDATAAVAEMVATLYDASLDAFRANGWPGGFDVFRRDFSARNARFENARLPLQYVGGGWPMNQKDAGIQYRRFPNEVLWEWARYGNALWGGGRVDVRSSTSKQTISVDNLREGVSLEYGVVTSEREIHVRGGRGGEVQETEKGKATDIASPAPRLDAVTPRRNLTETAFFFPHLISNSRGEVRMEFAMPEALTRWRFLGFAHDAKLRGGLLEGSAVTSLDFMVQPNPPRFLREGDVLEFTVKVTNQSDERQKGQVRLTFTDAETGEPRDAALENQIVEKPFDVPPRESRTFAWKLTVPDGAGVIAYKAVGSTGRQSDGEEGALPVLSRSILVTESLPLPIRGPRTRTFVFASLRESGASPTLRHQSFTVQMVSNPSWYAVMALPYLMEYPYECSEQIFNRLYANSLARHIATSQPRVRRVFERWKGTKALDSPLEKNQELKAVVLEESPWVRQALSESRARRNVAILFDDDRLNRETARDQERLARLQLADGAWPWFPGGQANDYITLYVTTGFGRLRHLGVGIDVSPALRSLDRLDGWVDQIYRDILRYGNKDQNHLSATIALYLYGRSFFLKERPVPESVREAVDYWLSQARRYWLELPGRQSQAHVALALKRFGDAVTPTAIMRSLRERAVTNEEMGMFWREDERSWWWYRAPIETQAVVIEAFHEVANDSAAVEDCKVWLLKQKQTQDWKTTKATADAVYALLLRGTDPLASEALVEVALGGQPVRADAVEAGTGFYEQRYTGAEITPAFADVTVKKTDAGVAWGSVHWQYFEDMSRVRAYTGTPLTLVKTMFVRETGSRGAALHAMSGPVHVGDELVVRIELRVDRDMEYVHLKDYRGSGVEPVNVLSGYRYQDGLRYYEQTRDAASHFFIDYLPKGTYVFEYPVRVQHRGIYQSGIAQIQCMYAPEFNSHSESLTLEVR